MESKMVSGAVISTSTQSPESEVIVSADKIISTLQEELEIIRLENKQCWRRVQHLETTIVRMRSSAQCSKEERDLLKKKLRELQTRLSSLTSPVAHKEGEDHGDVSFDQLDLAKESSTAVHGKIDLDGCDAALCRPPTPAVAPKMAERVRLKRIPTDEVFGSEICSLGVSNVRLAEHLAETVQEASQLQELYRSLAVSARQQEFEIELENLRNQTNRMKSQVAFLELTLNESRTLSDNLSSLCAQLESNETALQLALLFDDYIEQGSNCLLELGDSRLAFVLASCQAVHSDKGQENNELLFLAKKEREKLEIEAKKLLRHLESEASAAVEGIVVRTANDSECVAGGETWSRDDEIRLRSIIKIMKMQRDAIRSSVVKVQSTSSLASSNDRGNAISRSLQEEKLSLENIVLLQEMMALKEDKTQLKAKLLVLEKENEILLLSNREKDLQLAALKQKDNHRSEMKHASADIEINAETAPNGDHPSNLFEEVVATQEIRQRKSDYLIEYLKRINDSLLMKLQRLKRKHKAKLRRLQYALRYVSEQYELEISALRGQLSTEAARDSGNETQYSTFSEA